VGLSLWLATSSHAQAQISSADQICPPNLDPCVVNTVVPVADGVTLDFGLRELRIEGNGQLDVSSGFVIVACGAFTARTGTAVALKVRGPGSQGVIEGGVLLIRARGSCSNDPLQACIDDRECGTGTCSGGAGTISIDGRIRGEGSPPGSLDLEASRDIELLQSVVFSATGGQDDGGFLDLYSAAGSITIRDRIDVTSGSDSQGGEIVVVAGRDVVIDAELDADGGDFDGGIIEAEAGRDVVVRGDLRANSVSGEGFGGEISLYADRNVIIPGPARLSTNGHESLEFFCGDGGITEIDAGGDIELGETVVVESLGPMPDCDGGDFDLFADGSIGVAGTVDMRARGESGGGGYVGLRALGGVDLAASSVVDASGGRGDGEVELVADGDVLLDGTIDVIVQNDLGGLVSVRGGGAVTVAGTVNAKGTPNGTFTNSVIEVEGCTIDLLPGGRVDNVGGYGTNLLVSHADTRIRSGASVLADADSGHNRFVYREASAPPDVAGLVEPAAELVVDAALRACLVCGNGIQEHGETCDDGNTVSGDGCTADCVSEFCIGQTPGYPATALCDDDDPCTLDVCSRATHQCVSTHEPQPICQAGRSTVLIEDRFTSSGDRLRWKWRGISGTARDDFGHPDVDTSLALCVYDDRASEPVLATTVRIPPGRLWSASSSGFSYKDREAANDGVTRVRLLAAAGDVAKIVLKADGANVPIPSAVSDETILAQDPEVIVQLVADGGMCWSSTFRPERTKQRSRVRFKATAR